MNQPPSNRDRALKVPPPADELRVALYQVTEVMAVDPPRAGGVVATNVFTLRLSCGHVVRMELCADTDPLNCRATCVACSNEVPS